MYSFQLFLRCSRWKLSIFIWKTLINIWFWLLIVVYHVCLVNNNAGKKIKYVKSDNKNVKSFLTSMVQNKWMMIVSCHVMRSTSLWRHFGALWFSDKMALHYDPPGCLSCVPLGNQYRQRTGRRQTAIASWVVRRLRIVPEDRSSLAGILHAAGLFSAHAIMKR